MRRVNTGPKVGAAPAQAAVPDDYLGRLVKYIPAEIVGLYLTLTGIVPKTPSNIDLKVLWCIFGACAVLTPLYLYFSTRHPTDGRGPLLIQIILGTVAFPCWALAIGGNMWSGFGWYKALPYLPSLLLAFVTVVFGFVQPKAGS